jgi:hypothetical protein
VRVDAPGDGLVEKHEDVPAPKWRANGFGALAAINRQHGCPFQLHKIEAGVTGYWQPLGC